MCDKISHQMRLCCICTPIENLHREEGGSRCSWFRRCMLAAVCYPGDGFGGGGNHSCSCGTARKKKEPVSSLLLLWCPFRQPGTALMKSRGSRLRACVRLNGSYGGDNFFQKTVPCKKECPHVFIIIILLSVCVSRLVLKGSDNFRLLEWFSDVFERETGSLQKKSFP